MTVRAWSERCFAAYVDDERYGRFVGTAETRAGAESLVAQAESAKLKTASTVPSAPNRRIIRAAGRAAYHDPRPRP